jgi:hypothetical protein
MANRDKEGVDRRQFIKMIGMGSLAAMFGVAAGVSRTSKAIDDCARWCMVYCERYVRTCCIAYECGSPCEWYCPQCSQFACMQECCWSCPKPCPLSAEL